MKNNNSRKVFMLLNMAYAIILALLIIVYLMSATEDPINKVKSLKAVHQIKKIERAIHVYKENYDEYPVKLEQLLSGVDSQSQQLITRDDLHDPWDFPYEYQRKDIKDQYLLISKGQSQIEKEIIRNKLLNKIIFFIILIYLSIILIVERPLQFKQIVILFLSVFISFYLFLVNNQLEWLPFQKEGLTFYLLLISNVIVLLKSLTMTFSQYNFCCLFSIIVSAGSFVLLFNMIS